MERIIFNILCYLYGLCLICVFYSIYYYASAFNKSVFSHETISVTLFYVFMIFMSYLRKLYMLWLILLIEVIWSYLFNSVSIFYWLYVSFCRGSFFKSKELISLSSNIAVLTFSSTILLMVLLSITQLKAAFSNILKAKYTPKL